MTYELSCRFCTPHHRNFYTLSALNVLLLIHKKSKNERKNLFILYFIVILIEKGYIQ